MSPQSQTVDYDALAQQHGASAAPVDYDALAQQHGAGVEAEHLAAPPSFWDKVKKTFAPQQVPRMSDEEFAAYKKEHPESPGTTEGSGMLGGLAEWDKASGGEIAGGVGEILKGNVSRGLHRIISGTGNAAAPVAALVGPAMAAAAPVSTALSLAGGVAGNKVAEAGAEALGASPDQSALAGDIGGLIGGVAAAKLPAAASRTVLLGKTPQEAYQSALKPSTTIPLAKVERIVNTGLENEIPVSKSGSEKLSSLLDDLHDRVTAEIGAGQGKTVNKFKVASRLSNTADKFATQVNPEADLNAVSDAGNEFLRTQPGEIPAADAQALKVGTYRQLGSKAYGELKGATIESQKALARGIKEELANQFPELSSLNAAEGSMYDLQPVLEKAIQRQGNHQILGIGTPIAAGATKAVTGSSTMAAVAGAVKAVVDNPIVKSRLAIALSKGGMAPSVANARIRAYSAALAASAANSETEGDHATQ